MKSIPLLSRLRGRALPVALALLILGLSSGQASAAILGIPKTLTTTPGGTVNVPVNLTIGAGDLPSTLIGFTIALTYNSALFTLSAPTTGSVFSPTFAVTYNTTTPGVLIASGSETTGNGFPLSIGTNPLIMFNLTAAGNAPPGTSPINLLATFTNANGTATTELDRLEGNGIIPLNPAPTNGSNDAVDGLVTIAPVPEPSQVALLGLLGGLGGVKLAWDRRRRLKSAV